MPLLPLDRIRALHAAALDLGLADSRSTLFAAMPGVSARLTSTPLPSAQLLNDLNALNDLPLQAGLGDGPFEIWLETVVTLFAHDPRCDLFRDALRDVRQARRGGGLPLPVVQPSPSPVAQPPPQTPAKESPKSIRIFLSAAPEDKVFVDLLRKHISPFARSGLVTLRDRNTIAPTGYGTMDDYLQAEIGAAHIFLAFVSADYLADELGEKEGRLAFSAQSGGKLRIVPILTRPFNWQETAFKELQALPNNRQAIAEYPNADVVMVEIVKAVHEMAKEAAQGNARPPKAESEGRGMNMPAAKHFLDRPKYAWEELNAQQLFNKLSEAYSSEREIELQGQMAGIDLREWNRQGPPRQLWHSMLSIAAAQGKLRRLVEDVVLKDSSRAAYHPEIRACL